MGYPVHLSQVATYFCHLFVATNLLAIYRLYSNQQANFNGSNLISFFFFHWEIIHLFILEHKEIL